MVKLGAQESGLVRRNRTRACENSWTISASRETRYEVVTSLSLFDESNRTLSTHGEIPVAEPKSRRLLVIDESVSQRYGGTISHFFASHNVRADSLVLDARELTKNWISVSRVLDTMTRANLDRRNDLVVAIGGGVLLDVVGFAASVYRRGTPYIRIPTTLIGLVDAGVGVKTGINYARGKNRVGSYAAPLATYIDRTFLSSLTPRHLSNGFAEILKIALIKSPNLMTLIDECGCAVLQDKFVGSTPILAVKADEIIATSIQAMLNELQPNLWEDNLERCVDYGHTFSPTVEMYALPALLHGEAVCIDMALSSILAQHRGNMRRSELLHIHSTMQRLGLPIWDETLARPGILDDALAETVRHRGGLQRIPLPVGIGDHEFVNDISEVELHDALFALRDLGEGTGQVNDAHGATTSEEVREQ